eukprot:TRINITY_DN10516_c1_g3_i1.p1 TRINITY_DN10516_c1_g3~~TRINITY_DN10516_c1_g3_i1.p1  ORF type:complete len:848 (+),score=124.87 TRINITY_DN10516_c1_g3_i1:299-2545(+)
MRIERTQNTQSNATPLGHSSSAAAVVILSLSVIATQERPTIIMDPSPVPLLSHKSDCRLQGCMVCITDKCPAPGDPSRRLIAKGGYGVVSTFKVDGIPYAVKQIPLRRSASTLRAALSRGHNSQSLGEQNSVVSSIVGEIRRMWISGPHFIPLYGARYQDANSLQSTPSIEFIMEYSDWTLDGVSDMASKLHQHTLHKLAAKHGFNINQQDEGSPPKSESLACCVAAVILISNLVVKLDKSIRYRVPYLYNSVCDLKCNCSRSACVSCLRPVFQMRGASPAIADGILYRILRYTSAQTVQGDSLTEDHKGIIPEAVLSSIAQQIGCGLSMLRRQAIVHKDIKPTNILVNRRGQVKIADFGTSKTANHRENGKLSAVSPAGITTPDYQAPEMAESGILGEIGRDLCDLCDLEAGLDGLGGLESFNTPLSPPVDCKEFGTCIDVWAFGVTMLKLSTGHRDGPWCDPGLADPFASPSPECISDFRVPGTMSNVYKDFIKGLLRNSPDSRLIATLTTGWHDGSSILRHGFIASYRGEVSKCPCARPEWKEALRSKKNLPLGNFIADITTLAGPYLVFVGNNCQELTNAMVRNKIPLPPSDFVKSWSIDATLSKRNVSRMTPRAFSEWCDSTLSEMNTNDYGLVASVEDKKMLSMFHLSLRNRHNLLSQLESRSTRVPAAGNSTKNSSITPSDADLSDVQIESPNLSPSLPSTQSPRAKKRSKRRFPSRNASWNDRQKAAWKFSSNNEPRQQK